MATLLILIMAGESHKKASNEQRIEIIGPDYLHSDLLDKKGVFTERINYQTRYFIPVERETAKTLDAVINISPVCRIESSNGRVAAKSYSPGLEPKQPERVSAKEKPSTIAKLRAAASVIDTPQTIKNKNHQHDRG